MQQRVDERAANIFCPGIHNINQYHVVSVAHVVTRKADRNMDRGTYSRSTRGCMLTEHER